MPCDPSPLNQTTLDTVTEEIRLKAYCAHSTRRAGCLGGTTVRGAMAARGNDGQLSGACRVPWTLRRVGRRSGSDPATNRSIERAAGLAPVGVSDPDDPGPFTNAWSRNEPGLLAGCRGSRLVQAVASTIPTTPQRHADSSMPFVWPLVIAGRCCWSARLHPVRNCMVWALRIF